MRKILSCSVLFFVIGISESYAQSDIAGSYFKDNNRDKFVGTWQWSNSQDTFTVVLRKETFYYKKADITMDLIVGWHKYVKDGQTAETSLAHVGESFGEGNYTINGQTNSEDKNELRLDFKDLNSRRSRRATLELLPGEPDKSIWTLSFKEQIIINPDSTNMAKEGPKVPVPVEWTMKKIE